MKPIHQLIVLVLLSGTTIAVLRLHTATDDLVTTLEGIARIHHGRNAKYGEIEGKTPRIKTISTKVQGAKLEGEEEEEDETGSSEDDMMGKKDQLDFGKTLFTSKGPKGGDEPDLDLLRKMIKQETKGMVKKLEAERLKVAKTDCEKELEEMHNVLRQLMVTKNCEDELKETKKLLEGLLDTKNCTEELKKVRTTLRKYEAIYGDADKKRRRRRRRTKESSSSACTDDGEEDEKEMKSRRRTAFSEQRLRSKFEERGEGEGEGEGLEEAKGERQSIKATKTRRLKRKILQDKGITDKRKRTRFRGKSSIIGSDSEGDESSLPFSSDGSSTEEEERKEVVEIGSGSEERLQARTDRILISRLPIKPLPEKEIREPILDINDAKVFDALFTRTQFFVSNDQPGVFHFLNRERQHEIGIALQSIVGKLVRSDAAQVSLDTESLYEALFNALFNGDIEASQTLGFVSRLVIRTEGRFKRETIEGETEEMTFLDCPLVEPGNASDLHPYDAFMYKQCLEPEPFAFAVHLIKDLVRAESRITRVFNGFDSCITAFETSRKSQVLGQFTAIAEKIINYANLYSEETIPWPVRAEDLLLFVEAQNEDKSATLMDFASSLIMDDIDKDAIVEENDVFSKVVACECTELPQRLEELTMHLEAIQDRIRKIEEIESDPEGDLLRMLQTYGLKNVHQLKRRHQQLVELVSKHSFDDKARKLEDEWAAVREHYGHQLVFCPISPSVIDWDELEALDSIERAHHLRALKPETCMAKDNGRKGTESNTDSSEDSDAEATDSIISYKSRYFFWIIKSILMAIEESLYRLQDDIFRSKFSVLKAATKRLCDMIDNTIPIN